MKFFNKAKKWLITTLCASLCLSGALAVSSLSVKATEGGSESTQVSVSSDIQAILKGWNSVTSHNGGTTGANYSAAYGEWTLLDGTTKVKGIKLTLNQEESINLDDLVIPSNLLVDLTALKAGPNEVPAFAFIVQPTTKGATPISNIVPHFLSEDNKEGFGYDISGTDANKVTHAGPRIYGGNFSYKDYATYFHNYPKYAYGEAGATRTGYDLIGNSTEPFEIWYDGAHNVTYATCTNTHSQKDGTYITGVLGQEPTTYSDLNRTFVNPFADLDGVKELVSANSEWTGTFHEFDGFSGKGRIGLRLRMNSATKVDVILTAYAGVDLTNPQATSPAVLTANDKVAILGEKFIIPAPKYETALGNSVDKKFNGTVNVYAGKRDYLKPYTAYGANVASLKADLDGNEALYTNISVDDALKFTEAGNYTLEYVDTDGTVTYSNVLVSVGVKVTLDNVNTTVYRDGVVLNSGEKVTVNDELTFVAEGDYTLYDFSFKGDTGKKFILKNGAKTELPNGTYVVTEEDIENGALSLTSAAYTKRYTIRSNRNHYKASGYHDAYVFGGIDSTYYNKAGSGWGNSVSGCMYNMYSYDGVNLKLLSPLSGDVATWRKEQYGGDASRHLGYSVTDFNSQPLYMIKKGGDSSFEVTTDVDIQVLYDNSKIETSTSFIKTAGTVGLSVKFSMIKADYDKIVPAVSRGENEFTVNAVVVPAKYYDSIVADESFSETDKVDPYRFEAVKSKYPRQIASSAVEEWFEENINNVDYMSFYVTLKNINREHYADGYYFGAYYNLNSDNGDGYMCFGSNEPTDTSFPEISVLTAAQASFEKNVDTEKTDYAHVSLNNVDYYSKTATVTENEIKTLVKFYNYGLYLKGISLEEKEGYTKINGTDYYMDNQYITTEEKAKEVISFAKNVMEVA